MNPRAAPVRAFAGARGAERGVACSEVRSGRGQRGLSLLECAASIALAGLVLSSSAQASLSAATIVKSARALAATTDVARNLLEQELGAPCGAAPACPSGYRCQVTRSALTGTADRLVVRVERSDGAAIEELRTLAPPPACSG